MATNPMQRKSRISFLLGMLLMLVISAVVIVLLFMKMQEKDKKISEYENAESDVYVLSRDVKSGDTLDATAVKKIKISTAAKPSDAAQIVDPVIAKIDLKANTVLTKGAIALAEEKVTDDLRKEEFNVITLPVDLQPDEYVDIRLMLPNGQNYIVVSKKKVTIPISNGAYLADTIQMNLTEEENLIISAAIVEHASIDGSKLYASRYVEAGNQKESTISYIPNQEVWNLLRNDKNVVPNAVAKIQDTMNTVRQEIGDAKNKYGMDENIKTKIQESSAATLEERKNYLQSLVPTL